MARIGKTRSSKHLVLGLATVVVSGVLALPAQAADAELKADSVAATGPESRTPTALPARSAYSHPDRPSVEDVASDGELPGLRTDRSRTFLTEAGGRQARLYAEAVNVRNDHGQWDKIDNRLVPALGPEPFTQPLRNARGVVESVLPASLSEPVRVSGPGG